MGYYESKDVSNSSLKHINPDEGGSASLFYKWKNNELDSESSKSLDLGTEVHEYKLEPEKFTTLAVAMPSDTIKGIIDVVFAGSEGQPLDELKEEILDAANDVEYSMKWKDETRVNKVIEQGAEYYKALQECEGKRIVDHQTMSKLYNCVQSLSRNEYATELLESKSTNEVQYVNEKEVFFEMKVPGTDRVIKTRSKLDRLRVNTVNKTFRVIDLKTTSKHISKYKSAFEYYHTYRQVAFYKRAAESLLGPEFTFEGADIVAVMTVEPYLSRVYGIEADDKYIDKGEAEIDDLMTRIDFHTQAQNWVDDMEDVQDRRQFKLTLEE